jgi:hypothetical protein
MTDAGEPPRPLPWTGAVAIALLIGPDEPSMRLGC